MSSVTETVRLSGLFWLLEVGLILRMLPGRSQSCNVTRFVSLVLSLKFRVLEVSFYVFFCSTFAYKD